MIARARKPRPKQYRRRKLRATSKNDTSPYGFFRASPRKRIGSVLKDEQCVLIVPGRACAFGQSLVLFHERPFIMLAAFRHVPIRGDAIVPEERDHHDHFWREGLGLSCSRHLDIVQK
jgi:hypothetical protein